MTMKTKKTLQHIAAVAVVLLTLCLVFVAPVSAASFTTTVVVGENTYGTLEEAIAVATSASTTISLPDYGCEFTLADDGQFYIDADQKTGRMVYLTIARAGSSTVGDGTLFNVSTNGSVLLTNQNVQQIMLNSESRLDAKGSLLENGDILLFPAATIYDDSGGIVDTYGDITFIGAGADKTVICPVSIYDNGYRYFRLYNRYVDNIGDPESPNDIYEFTFKNLSFDGQHNKGAGLNAFVVTCYNIEINAENVVFKNFPGSVFSVWANDVLTDATYPTKDWNVGVKIDLVNVSTDNNGRLVHFDTAPYKTTYLDRYGFVELTYDEACSFKDTELYSICADSKLYQGNMLINGEDITLDSAVAKIGDTYYGTLDSAVSEAKDGDTITLLKDVTGTTKVTIDKSITIDGVDGTKITRTTDYGAAIYVKNSTEGVTLDVTLQNVEVSGIYAVYLGSKTNLDVKSSTLNGWSAIYFANHEADADDSDGSVVAVSKSTLIGTNTKSGPENDFGVIVFEAGNSTASFTDSTLKAIAEGTSNQSVVLFSDWYGPNSNDVVTFTGGALAFETGDSASTFVWTADDAVDDIVTVGAGVSTNFDPSDYISSDMEVVEMVNGYYVQKYVAPAPSSGGSSSTEDPETPEEPVNPETPEEPETPVDEPVAGEPTVETEVTDGGEVTFETPEAGEPGDAPSDAPAEPVITGVDLPEGTDSEVAFIPVSEKPAPAGKEENTKKVFEINVPKYEKGKPATVKFTMTVAELTKDGKTAADVALWHHDEETGEWTKLVTTFTIIDGVVYFEAITFDFSPFAIVYEDTELPTDEPETPEQPTESPAPILAVLAGLGAAVVLRRK